MAKYLLTLTLIFFGFCGFSQKINENKFYSTYKYIIRLDSSQLRFLIEKNKVDTSMVFNHVIDSFLKDSVYNYNKLDFGTYLICYVHEHNIYFNTYHKHPFILDVWGVNTKNYVILKDDENKVIEGAKISLLDNKTCPFSIGMASYELPKIKNGTIIKVEYKGYFDYIVVNPSYYNPPTYKNSYPNYNHTTILPGYISLNQPRYKQNDTLKFKAFLLNQNGTYYYKNVSVSLYDEYNNKEKLIKTYRYKTPSAYFGEFVLGDTLIPDKQYTLIFRNSEKEELKRITFTIENYELKKNTYELSMISSTIYPGQKIVVVVKAYDANNLPLMDGFVKFNIHLNQLSQVNTNKFFIPTQWYQSMYTFEKELDPSGYTTLEIPDTIFHNMDCQMMVDATFSDEDNEVVQRSVSFSYQNKNHIYSITAQRDSLKVNYFYLSKSSEQKLRLVTIYYSNKKSSQEITTPFTQKTDYSATRYELYKNDTLVYQYNCPEPQNLIGVFGKRTCDSVFINLYNPLKIPIHYEIYKNKTKITEGKSETLEFKRADHTAESYYIVWGHNYKGMLRNNYRTQAFHFEEKKLTVEINQPQEIYPGQIVDVSVKITDAKLKPAENVNLTAYSVNTQFGEIPLPDVPYLGLIRNDERLHFTQPGFQFFNTNANFVLKYYQINALHLYRNEMYKLVFSKEAKTILDFKTKKKNPEYAVYLFQQNRLQPVVSIILDEQIVYHSKNSIPQQYSFITSAGSHNLKIRSNNLLINYGEIIFADSNKYIIGINLDSLKKADTTRLLPGMFEKKEYRNYLNQTFFIHVDERLDTLKIYQNDKLCFFGDYRTKYKTVYHEKDYFYVFTMFEKGDLRIKMNRKYEHDVQFEPNKVYYMNSNEVRSYPLSEKGVSGLLYFDNTPNEKYNLNSFQQLYINPDDSVIDTTKTKPVVKEEKKKRQPPFIYYRDFLPKPIAGKPSNSLFIYQKHDYVPYRRAWLIHKRFDSLSVVVNYQNYFSYVDSGTYDLVLLNDTAMCISKNLYLPLGGSLHLFLYANEIKELNQEEIWEYEQIVKRVTKVPLRLFTDSPISIKPLIMKVNKTNKAYGKLSGSVVDALYFGPLDNTTIIAEINGVFKGGALTNEDGEFVMDFLTPGNYMLKIREAGYRYQVIYDLQIDAGIEKIVKIKLLNLEDEVRYSVDGEVIYSNMPERNSRVDEGESMGTKDVVRMKSTSINKIESMAAGAYSLTSPSSAVSVMSVQDSYTWDFGDTKMEEVAIATGSLNNGILDPGVPFEKINEEKMQQKLNDLSQEVKANRTRNVFRDYGYWVPNIITNKQGEAKFTVQFPDNITGWKTMVPAMNDKRESGLSTMVTKSYKPLLGAMGIPNYLIAGDKIQLKGKVINYTGNNQEMKLNFFVNDILRKSYYAKVEKVLTDTFMIQAGKPFDTITAAFQLQMNNGYTDGEERKIPVYPNGILISRSEYIDLIKDTAFQYIAPKDIRKAVVYVHSSMVEQLRYEIEELKHYSYGCTEQTASKLRALLAEKSIDATLKIPFKSDKEIKQLIKRLNDLRNNDGTWGWWHYDREDHWLTMYVIRTLNEARLAGYSNNAYMRAANKLEKEVSHMNLQGQLETLNLLKDMDRKAPYDTLISKMNYETMDINQKLLYIHLLQNLKKKYDINEVIVLSNQLPGGGLSWGTNIYNYKYDEAANTLIAFDILRKDSIGRAFLPNIKAYFNGATFTRHTLARAGLINMYLNDWNAHHTKKEAIFGEIKVDGTKLNANDFPFKRTYKSNDTIDISHKGNESYVNIVTTKIETKPQPDETFFKIKSSVFQKNDSLILKAGQITTLEVNVEVFKTSENVMLEIPIPAGCNYYGKPKGNTYVESNREYYNDKTSIFCTTLPRGKYSFTIQVVPKYSGIFNLPPAKIELMYYPEIRNNEVPKVLVVE